jgi:hypothetical protein
MGLDALNPSFMPRDRSLTLSDVREPALTIVCERCGRYGGYSVKRLIRKRNM